MVRILILWVCLLAGLYGQAQNITIEVNRDTISLQDQFQVKYTVDKSCDMMDLSFPHFLIVAGPSSSRSIQIINGKRSAKTSYSVVLTAIEEGVFPLPMSFCGAKMEKPVNIVVIDGYVSKESLEAKIRKTKKIKKI